MYFLKYYVDDGKLALETFPPGARLVNGKVVVMDEHKESDKIIPHDKRTANIILQLANSVTNTIKLTIEYPTNNSSGWMTILDIQVRVRDNRIEYKFYKKSMANHLTAMERSAVPDKIKRCSHTQEVIRRLRNTSINIDWSTKADILSEFCNSLLTLGYS